MEVIERNFNHGRADTFNIYPIGDCHTGSVHCAENDVRRMVETIRKDPKGYWIGLGDICDSILKNDKRFDIEGLASWVRKDNIIESQRQWVKDVFSPIAGKCIAYLTGNHEETIHLHHDCDITRNICDDLKVPYGGYSCFVNLRFLRKSKDTATSHTPIHTVLIHAWHGAGAAQTEGSRVMRLMRLVNEVQADIYLMGHLHVVAQYTPDRLILHNGKVKSRELIAVITGSWLKSYTQPKQGQRLNPSYSEQKGYKPSRIGAPVIHITPSRAIFTVEG